MPLLSEKATLDMEATLNAGAPKNLTVGLELFHNGTLNWDVVWQNKRPTRLPEAVFFQFRPALSPAGWILQVGME